MFDLSPSVSKPLSKGLDVSAVKMNPGGLQSATTTSAGLGMGNISKPAAPVDHTSGSKVTNGLKSGTFFVPAVFN